MVDDGFLYRVKPIILKKAFHGQDNSIFGFDC